MNLLTRLCLLSALGGACLPVASSQMQSSSQHNKSAVSWSSVGPGGGGWLTDITIVDDAHSTIYVSCDVGGVYKSTDQGASWQIKDKGLDMYFVQDVAFDPQVTSTLYAGTRGGVFKSIDGGDHWVAKRTGFPPVNDYVLSAPVSDVLVDPNNPDVLYAGVGIPRQGYVLDAYNWTSTLIKGAIYKSQDGGENWILIQGTGMHADAMVYSLTMDPTDSSVIYAATSKGVYKSQTSGVLWTAKNVGLPNPKAMSLVVDATQPNVLYTTLWAEPGGGAWAGGVYKSVDGGDSWVPKNNGLPGVMGSVEGLTCNYPGLVIDPQNPLVLYAGNNAWTPDPGVYKTIDGGDSWTWVTRDENPGKNMELGWITVAGNAVKCLAIDPNHAGRLLFGTSMELFKTEDGGLNWEQVYSEDQGGGYWKGRGFETTVVQAITVDPTDSNNVYAGFWDMGFLKSTDGGASYKKTDAGMTYRHNTFSIEVDPASPNIIYAATGWWEDNEGEVCRSVDFGETWTPLTNGIPDAQIWSIALDRNSPVNSRTLYATSYENGLYKTVNGGQSWTSASVGLGTPENLQVRTVAVHPTNSNVVFAGLTAKLNETAGGLETVQGGLYKSTDAGASWNRVDQATPQLSVWDIKFDASQPANIYTAVSTEYDHTLHTTFPGGVYRSSDGGVSWSTVNVGFGSTDNLEVLALAMHPTRPNILFAATSDSPYHDSSTGRGLFMTRDAGAHWFPINQGLGVLNFDAIAVDSLKPSILFAGSGGNGIFKGHVPRPRNRVQPQ